MATTTITTTSKQFKDLDLNFMIHPMKKDINKNLNEMAIVNSIKNIVMTNYYEKPFYPDFGSGVRSLLFENIDPITSAALEREIQTCLTNFEPRVSVISVTVAPNYDENHYNISLYFSIENRTDPVTISFILQRLR